MLLGLDHLVDEVVPADEAAERFNLARDRIGDLIVLGKHSSVLGRRPDYHDLSEVRATCSTSGLCHAVP